MISYTSAVQNINIDMHFINKQVLLFESVCILVATLFGLKSPVFKPTVGASVFALAQFGP